MVSNSFRIFLQKGRPKKPPARPNASRLRLVGEFELLFPTGPCTGVLSFKAISSSGAALKNLQNRGLMLASKKNGVASGSQSRLRSSDPCIMCGPPGRRYFEPSLRKGSSNGRALRCRTTSKMLPGQDPRNCMTVQWQSSRLLRSFNGT